MQLGPVPLDGVLIRGDAWQSPAPRAEVNA